jgi:hypothetical protein
MDRHYFVRIYLANGRFVGIFVKRSTLLSLEEPGHGLTYSFTDVRHLHQATLT